MRDQRVLRRADQMHHIRPAAVRRDVVNHVQVDDVGLVEAEEKIKNYRQQIHDIKGVVRCSQCGAEVQSGVAFCSSCGTPMPKVQPINTDDIVRCESCGAMVKKGVHFCTSCGKPMTQMIAPEAISVPVAESEGQNSVCPKCGAKIETGVAFCTECGTKL